MFTSGSTGTPKGVVVPHRAVVGLVTGQTYADFGPELRTLLLAPTAFDASTFELWGPLLHGGTVVIYPDRYFELHRFGEVVQEGRVTSGSPLGCSTVSSTLPRRPSPRSGTC